MLLVYIIRSADVDYYFSDSFEAMVFLLERSNAVILHIGGYVIL